MVHVGGVVTIDQLKTDGFGVFGNYSKDATTAYGENLFKNQKVTYSDPNWTYSPLRFWPEQGHIDFLAYAPYDATATLKKKDATETALTCIDFKVEKNVADQKDLLYAKAEGKKKDNISSTGNKVKFHFYHALSKLGYSVKLYGDYTSNNVKFSLNNITLAGSAPNAAKSAQAFYTKGIIDLSTGNWTSKDATKQDFTWLSETKDVTSASASKPYKNPTSDYLFVIPQDFSQDGNTLYVIVKYTITYTDGGAPSITNTVYKKLTTNFKEGKAYTLNLTIGLPIEFDVDVVEDWKAPEDGTGDINIGSNDNNPWDR